MITKDATKAVSDQFILAKDVKALEDNFTKLRNLKFVGFRRTGNNSISRLGEGLAPKPHTILDKSIREDDLSKIDMTTETELLGYVAHRNKSGEIDGLYLSQTGKRELKHVKDENQEPKYQFCAVSDEAVYVCCKKEDLAGLLKEKKEYFVTGDYDLHDIVLQGGSCIYNPPSGGKDEADILFALAGLFSENPGRVHGNAFIPSESSRIQHGAQYNYIAFTFNEERKTHIVQGVAELSLEVALYDGSEWTIIQNDKGSKVDEKVVRHYQIVNPDRLSPKEKQAYELDYYYETHGAHLKYSWKQYEERAKEYIQYISGKSLSELYGGGK